MEEEFNPKEIKNLKRVAVKYIDSENNQRIFDADVVFVSEKNITLSSVEKGLKLDAPQMVTLKYFQENAMCDADTILDCVKIANGQIYLIVDNPKKVKRINRRKYYRIALKRVCVLVATDKKGNTNSYMSRLVDISLGGLLIHKLESMVSDNYVKIEPADYKSFNIVLFLDIDIVLKLSARFVRYEKGRVSHRYGFEFTNMKKEDIAAIGQYITKEQVKRRQKQRLLVN